MDLDWDDVGAADASSVQVALCDDAQTALVCPSSPELEARARPSRWTVDLPAPAARNFAQMCLAAARMRDRKAAKAKARRAQEIRHELKGDLENLRASGFLRDHGKTKVLIGSRLCASLRVPNSSSRVRIPFSTATRKL